MVTARPRKALQRVVRTAQYITGAKLPAMQELRTRRCQRKALKLSKTPATVVIDCSLCYCTASGTGSPSLGPRGFYPQAETHVIHTFKEDFYGQILSVVLVGYIRPERSYDSLDALIAAINHDIEEAKRKLDLPEHLKLKKDNFFIASASSSMTSSNKITKGH